MSDLRGRLVTDINWLRTIAEVADSDLGGVTREGNIETGVSVFNDEDMNWLIPTLIIDWRGYDMNLVWEQYQNIDKDDNIDIYQKNRRKITVLIARIDSLIEEIQVRAGPRITG